MLPPTCRLHWYEPRERGCRRDLSWLKVRMCSAHAYNKVFLYYQELRRTANVCSFLLDSAMNFSGPALPGCLRLVPSLWQAFMEHVILFLEVKCSVIYVSSYYIIFPCCESKVNPSQWILCYKNEVLIPQQIFNTWTQLILCVSYYIFSCAEELFIFWQGIHTDWWVSLEWYLMVFSESLLSQTGTLI